MAGGSGGSSSSRDNGLTREIVEHESPPTLEVINPLTGLPEAVPTGHAGSVVRLHGIGWDDHWMPIYIDDPNGPPNQTEHTHIDGELFVDIDWPIDLTGRHVIIAVGRQNGQPATVSTPIEIFEPVH